jgi:DNA invertase Pin-like site-specific DNA recombinase
MAPHPLITPEQDHDIVRLYDEGIQVAEIARLTGTSNESVYNALRRQGRRPDRNWETRRHRQWYPDER